MTDMDLPEDTAQMQFEQLNPSVMLSYCFLSGETDTEQMYPCTCLSVVRTLRLKHSSSCMDRHGEYSRRECQCTHAHTYSHTVRAKQNMPKPAQAMVQTVLTEEVVRSKQQETKVAGREFLPRFDF